jgi:hypothetical protein
MGIVAFCPAGHRIKVKDHLAGKKGICPTCGGRFRIPEVEHAGPRDRDPDALPVAAIVSLDPGLAATLPPALAIAETDCVVEIVGDATDEMPPPIADNASASWCVAVPGGQPSPAMTADTMLAWLASGQVTGNEVVWRSDWSDWRPVAEVFPDHVPESRFGWPAGG